MISITVFFWSFHDQEYRVDEDRFVIHQVDPKKGKLVFYWKDQSGKIYGSLQNLKQSLDSANQELLFAMNGGMYKKDRSPQGLFIQYGALLQPVENRNTGYGNFYLQPNGIFYLTEDKEAHIIKTADFKIKETVKYATQSGPMLLIDGKYHKKLIKGSTNLHVRNGVGMLPDGQVLFAMSKEKVNFYDLATLFKQRGCKNALYLDGFVSRTYLPAQEWRQLDGDFGVIIGEIK